MIRDWLRKREDVITPQASHLRQAGLLVLSKIAKNLFSFFPFFYSSFHVLDSSISEQFLRIFPTLALVNITQIQEIRYS
jgi:hypothetical protein